VWNNPQTLPYLSSRMNLLDEDKPSEIFMWAGKWKKMSGTKRVQYKQLKVVNNFMDECICVYGLGSKIWKIRTQLFGLNGATRGWERKSHWSILVTFLKLGHMGYLHNLKPYLLQFIHPLSTIVISCTLNFRVLVIL